MPSKTFHFGPESQEVLLDLFEHHLALTCLLEASTGIVASDANIQPLAREAIAAADLTWVRVLRNSGRSPN